MAEETHGKVDPYLTESDLVLLHNLLQDADKYRPTKQGHTSCDPSPDLIERSNSGKEVHFDSDGKAVQHLKALNNPKSLDFRPTVFVSWDEEDLPEFIRRYVTRPYTRVAVNVVRHPTDVVFLTHILMYLFINFPSAIWLFNHFTYIHGIIHAAFTFWCIGSFTLLLHNHIHNNGVLSREWSWLDFVFPYIIEPLMGHTWDSYYYHHVKHHHIESNGPDDLSSTIRYQRDDLLDFLHYVGRFLFFVWLELPLYFTRKKKHRLAARAFFSEVASFAFLYFMTVHLNARAAFFVLIVPFVLLRIALMVGNWGQHALVDEVEPDSDFRSSITLIDVPSNRFCFNDGYHTAHHLNPRRHWREHPVHFLESKTAYCKGRALVFHNIDYLMMTVRLLQKDYMHLAECLVPIGDQIGMSQQELAEMLRTKTRRFTEEQIRKKFSGSAAGASSRHLEPTWKFLIASICDVSRHLGRIATRASHKSGAKVH